MKCTSAELTEAFSARGRSAGGRRRLGMTWPWFKRSGRGPGTRLVREGTRAGVEHECGWMSRLCLQEAQLEVPRSSQSTAGCTSPGRTCFDTGSARSATLVATHRQDRRGEAEWFTPMPADFEWRRPWRRTGCRGPGPRLIGRSRRSREEASSSDKTSSGRWRRRRQLKDQRAEFEDRRRMLAKRVLPTTFPAEIPASSSSSDGDIGMGPRRDRGAWRRSTEWPI